MVVEEGDYPLHPVSEKNVGSVLLEYLDYVEAVGREGWGFGQGNVFFGVGVQELLDVGQVWD